MPPMLRLWWALVFVCGFVACQPVGPNLPMLVLHDGGYVNGTLQINSLVTSATLCLTFRAVELDTPRVQPLVYVGNYESDEGFGFGLDESFNITVFQARTPDRVTDVGVTPDVTNFVCVAYTFNAAATTVRVFVYQPSFQVFTFDFDSARILPSPRLTVGGWAGNTFTGFVNNLQVYGQAFSPSELWKFNFNIKTVAGDHNMVTTYPFREGQGDTIYDLVGANSLKVVGKHSWHKRFTKALTLSDPGSAIRMLTPNNIVAGVGDMTLAMWIKLSASPTPGMQDLFVVGNTNIFLDTTANRFGVTLNDTTLNFDNYDVSAIQDKWTYIAFVFDVGSGVKLFVNTEPVDTVLQPFTFEVAPEQDMTVGGGNMDTLQASITSIQIWSTIDDNVWGTGYTRVALDNFNSAVAAFYDLTDEYGTTIYNWYYPPLQAQLEGNIEWENIAETAVDLTPDTTIRVATNQALSTSATWLQFTFSMNIHWRGLSSTAPSVIAYIGDFADVGFGLIIDANGVLYLSIGYEAGKPADSSRTFSVSLPRDQTTSLAVTVDFVQKVAELTLGDGTTGNTQFGSVYADINALNANVWIGKPGDFDNTYTGFNGLISDFILWRSLRNEIFFGGDAQKNALVASGSTVPFVYMPLNDQNGNAITMSGLSTTVSPPLTASAFPDRPSQFVFVFPTYTPDGTVIPPVSTTGPLSSTPETPSADTGPPLGIIVPAIIVPVVVAGVGLALLLVLLKRRRKNARKKASGDKKVVTLENPVNDVESARTNFAETRSTSYSNIPMSRVATSNNETSRNVDKLLNLAVRDRLNIPHEKITFIEEIGSGSFGKVYKGDWQHCEVAVKVANVVASMDAFIQEAELMMAIRPHPNVVQLLGVSVDGASPEMVLEFCPSGSLDTLLQSNVPLSDDQKVKLALGIARGMLHLHLNSVIHRDLAARNILLSKDGQPKISDFGMSRVLGSDVAHTGQTRSYVGPIKWMAPEALREAIYGRKTDVWSFGITVWEIITRKEPFDGVDLIQAALLIRDQGVTPEIPAECPPVLRELMRMCWQADPEQRPEFEEICKFLQKELKN